jgi:hypothetical protein
LIGLAGPFCQGHFVVDPMPTSRSTVRVFGEFSTATVENSFTLALSERQHLLDEAVDLIAALPTNVVATRDKTAVEIPSSEPHLPAICLLRGRLRTLQLIPLDESIV